MKISTNQCYEKCLDKRGAPHQEIRGQCIRRSDYQVKEGIKKKILTLDTVLFVIKIKKEEIWMQ
jgi:hypothetical protein